MKQKVVKKKKKKIYFVLNKKKMKFHSPSESKSENKILLNNFIE